jgi:hypothetical protein
LIRSKTEWLREVEQLVAPILKSHWNPKVKERNEIVPSSAHLVANDFPSYYINPTGSLVFFKDGSPY